MKFNILFLLLICFQSSFGQWTRINSVPSGHIVALAENNNMLFAATDSSLIYVSTDSGSVWNPIAVSSSPIDITTLTFFNSKIFVGTYTHGVYYSSDGIVWNNNGSNPNWISGFAINNNHLYASTLGNGVAVLDTNSNTWSFVNDSLPNYSVNVFSIIASDNFLIIAPGSNGTYYNYDFNSHSWVEGYYDGILHPGLQISKLIQTGDTIYAVNFQRVIRSDDAGQNWVEDATDTHQGTSRTIYEGTTDYYLVTNLIPDGTYIQHRDKNSAVGDTWAINEELLPTGFSYDILEFNNKLYLGKADGLYENDLSLGVKNNFESPVFSIYPNPSSDGKIRIDSKEKIISVEIFDELGSVYQKEFVNDYQFQTRLQEGIYFLRLSYKDGVKTAKLIVGD